MAQRVERSRPYAGLGLSGRATAYRELADQHQGNDLSRDEWLALMLDREMAVRADKRRAIGW